MQRTLWAILIMSILWKIILKTDIENDEDYIGSCYGFNDSIWLHLVMENFSFSLTIILNIHCWNIHC